VPEILEGKLRFRFPGTWTCSKFDDWSFYRNQFMKLADACLNCSNCEGRIHCNTCGSKRVAGTKGVDILAIDDTRTCWNIEVKDYRETRTSNYEFLAEEVSLKVRDTLACLVVAGINSSSLDEQSFAKATLKCKKFRIVLHLEQPPVRTPLSSTSIRRANVLQRLKGSVRQDAHICFGLACLVGPPLTL
jgi:hypothetical protein